MSQRLRLGISGCGGIAQYTFHESAGLETIQPVAAYDPNPTKMAKFRSAVEVEEVESFEALIGRKDIDAVILTGPPYVRADQAVLAAQAGKAVYSEKPLALTVADCKRMIKACDEAKVPFMVGQVLRYFGPFGRMADQIRAGAYGKPLSFLVNRYSPPFPRDFRDDWRLKWNLSGGLLFEVHVHEFDYSRYLFGEPVKITAESRKVGPDKEIDFPDLYFGTIEFESGLIGQYHFSHISTRGETRFNVFLEKGTAWAGFDGSWIQYWESGKKKEAEEGYSDPIAVISDKPEEIQGENEPPYRREIRLFADAVLNKTPVAIPAEEGLKAVAMAECFEEAARQRKTLFIKDFL